MSAQTDIAVVLWKTADELERLHGPHPHVPIEETKRVARTVIDNSQFLNKDKLTIAVEKQIDTAFKRSRK